MLHSSMENISFTEFSRCSYFYHDFSPTYVLNAKQIANVHLVKCEGFLDKTFLVSVLARQLIVWRRVLAVCGFCGLRIVRSAVT